MDVYDILYKRGEQDDGKGIWLRCGVLLEKPDGKKSIKLDMVPTGNDWNGWLVVARRERQQDHQPQSQGWQNGQGGHIISRDTPF